jgi:hypothetical protein
MRPSASQVVTNLAMRNPDFIATEESDDDMTDMDDDLHLANVDVDKVPRIARKSNLLTMYNWQLPVAWTLACSPRDSKRT